MNQAQLITPEGKTIVLPEYVYVKVKEMLAAEKPALLEKYAEARELDTPPPLMTPVQVHALIQETMGKYAGKKSMTKALLRIRAEERTRERRIDATISKRFFHKHARGRRKARVRAG